jgi:hypothetical protein
VLVLVEKFNSGFDMVVGVRGGKYYHGSTVKRPISAILRFLVEWTAERQMPDINSGLRVFLRETVTPYLNHLCDKFSSRPRSRWPI